MFKILFSLLSVVGLCAGLADLLIDGRPSEGLVRSALFVGLVTAMWLVIRAIRGLWRASRALATRSSVRGTGEAAGRLTGRASGTLSDFVAGVKDGFRSGR